MARTEPIITAIFDAAQQATIAKFVETRYGFQKLTR